MDVPIHCHDDQILSPDGDATTSGLLPTKRWPDQYRKAMFSGRGSTFAGLGTIRRVVQEAEQDRTARGTAAQHRSTAAHCEP